MFALHFSLILPNLQPRPRCPHVQTESLIWVDVLIYSMQWQCWGKKRRQNDLTKRISTFGTGGFGARSFQKYPTDARTQGDDFETLLLAKGAKGSAHRGVGFFRYPWSFYHQELFLRWSWFNANWAKCIALSQEVQPRGSSCRWYPRKARSRSCNGS